MRFWYVLHTQMSLHTCAVWPEPLLLRYSKYGSRWRFRQKRKCVVPLDNCQCLFNSFLAGGDFCLQLITLANSLDPDQDRQSIDPGSKQFDTNIFFLSQQTTTKAWKITQHAIKHGFTNTVKPVLSGHSKRTPNIGFQDRLSLNAGQQYCRMLQGEHSAILLTFIMLPFVIKIFVLSILRGFTVCDKCWSILIKSCACEFVFKVPPTS